MPNRTPLSDRPEPSKRPTQRREPRGEGRRAGVPNSKPLPDLEARRERCVKMQALRKPGSSKGSPSAGGKRRVKRIVGGVELEIREALFAQAYVEKLSGAQAVIDAGYNPSSMYSLGTELLKRPHVMQAIQNLFEERAKRLEISQDQVVRYWWNLAHADAREFAVRTNCRYCWGQDFQYQFTLNEMRLAKQQHYEKQLKRPENSRVPFDDLGGDGYDLTREPNPECPECRGLGAYNPQALDLSTLSPTAAMLYNGIKPTTHGYEISMRDRSFAMQQVQNLLGFVVDRRVVLVKAPDLEKLSDSEIAEAIMRLEKKVDLDENEFSEVGDDGNVINADETLDKSG
jgi:phage terminase small subunit